MEMSSDSSASHDIHSSSPRDSGRFTLAGGATVRNDTANLPLLAVSAPHTAPHSKNVNRLFHRIIWIMYINTFLSVLVVTAESMRRDGS